MACRRLNPARVLWADRRSRGRRPGHQSVTGSHTVQAWAALRATIRRRGILGISLPPAPFAGAGVPW